MPQNRGYKVPARTVKRSSQPSSVVHHRLSRGGAQESCAPLIGEKMNPALGVCVCVASCRGRALIAPRPRHDKPIQVKHAHARSPLARRRGALRRPATTTGRRQRRTGGRGAAGTCPARSRSARSGCR
eukprot:5949132-Prymnesium_polylepis.1